MERAFVCRRFSQVGSLYYKEDIESALQERPLYADGAEDDASARFRIGPYVDWDICRGTRANVEADRGPCMFIFSDLLPQFHSLYSGPDALSFVRAIINIQQKSLKEFFCSRSVNEVMSCSTLDTSPDFHICLLDQLLAVIPHVLPPDLISFPVL
jgi:hypothetical protein